MGLFLLNVLRPPFCTLTLAKLSRHSRVGEGEVFPTPICLSSFCYFSDFGLSEKKLFFSLSGFQMIGHERLNEWY